MISLFMIVMFEILNNAVLYIVPQNISNQIKNYIFPTSITEYSNFSKKILFKWNQIVT